MGIPGHQSEDLIFPSFVNKCIAKQLTRIHSFQSLLAGASSVDWTSSLENWGLCPGAAGTVGTTR